MEKKGCSQRLFNALGINGHTIVYGPPSHSTCSNLNHGTISSTVSPGLIWSLKCTYRRFYTEVIILKWLDFFLPVHLCGRGLLYSRGWVETAHAELLAMNMGCRFRRTRWTTRRWRTGHAQKKLPTPTPFRSHTQWRVRRRRFGCELFSLSLSHSRRLKTGKRRSTGEEEANVGSARDRSSGTAVASVKSGRSDAQPLQRNLRYLFLFSIIFLGLLVYPTCLIKKNKRAGESSDAEKSLPLSLSRSLLLQCQSQTVGKYAWKELYPRSLTQCRDVQVTVWFSSVVVGSSSECWSFFLLLFSSSACHADFTHGNRGRKVSSLASVVQTVRRGRPRCFW